MEVRRLLNKKTTTIVISLLAFAIMYSTFITETGLTTGKYVASKYATPNIDPVNTWEKPKLHTSNNPRGVNTPGYCTDSDGGNNPYIQGTAMSGKEKYTDYCTDNTHLVEYYCGEGQNFDKGYDVRYKLYDCREADKVCLNGACI
jgi:hypothetical protein